jgi:hypothetical protein
VSSALCLPEAVSRRVAFSSILCLKSDLVEDTRVDAVLEIL